MLSVLRHASGRLTAEEETFIPESERRRVVREARAWVAIYIAVVALAVVLGSFLPLMYVGLPSLYGRWLAHFFAFTQHAGLAENVLDHRLNSRTVYMNPVFRFLYWNMNYHIEHHMFPMVPYHALPELHEELRADMPVPCSSTIAAYREILPTLRRQLHEPEYYLAARAAAHRRSRSVPTCTAWWSMARMPSDERWVDACGVDRRSTKRTSSASTMGTGPMPIYRSPEDTFHATDGLCTHERAHLADGLVMGDIIECPKHNGRFDYKTGEAKRRPACVDLRTYPVMIAAGRVYVALD